MAGRTDEQRAELHPSARRWGRPLLAGAEFPELRGRGNDQVREDVAGDIANEDLTGQPGGHGSLTRLRTRINDAFAALCVQSPPRTPAVFPKMHCPPAERVRWPSGGAGGEVGGSRWKEEVAGGEVAKIAPCGRAICRRRQ